MAQSNHRGLRELTDRERLATHDLLAELSPDQLAMPSLSERWTVEDVAYLIAIGPYFNRGLISAFRYGALAGRRGADALDGQEIDNWTRHGGFDKVLRVLARPLPSRKLSPFGLMELVVHVQDIRRPLGIVREYSSACLSVVLKSTMAARVAIAADERIDGLCMRATDVDWAHGTGPEVKGTGEAVLMAAHGRRAALQDLTGPGVPILASRIAK